MKTTLTLLALAGLALNTEVRAMEWFPAEPGHDEPVYLMYMDFCGENPPSGQPTLALIDADEGRWEFRIDHQLDTLCFATPPEGSARAYAFEIPERIDDIQVDEVRVAERLIHPGGVEESVTSLYRPSGVATPASIAGTWNSAGAREQGLLITMDESRQLVVSFNTYDAQGAKAWYSGIGHTDSTVNLSTLSLSDTDTGVFMDSAVGDPPARTWGEVDIDWNACGELRLAWRPAVYTGLQAGAADFTQLTGSASAPCNLEKYARTRNGRPLYLPYHIEK